VKKSLVGDKYGLWMAYLSAALIALVVGDFSVGARRVYTFFFTFLPDLNQ